MVAYKKLLGRQPTFQVGAAVVAFPGAELRACAVAVLAAAAYAAPPAVPVLLP